jgi:hypothetical protein
MQKLLPGDDKNGVFVIAFNAKTGMVQKMPILGNTDNSNPTRILRVSID